MFSDIGKWENVCLGTHVVTRENCEFWETVWGDSPVDHTSYSHVSCIQWHLTLCISHTCREAS